MFDWVLNTSLKTVDLLTITKEIFNRKFHFLCSVAEG